MAEIKGIVSSGTEDNILCDCGEGRWIEVIGLQENGNSIIIAVDDAKWSTRDMVTLSKDMIVPLRDVLNEAIRQLGIDG